MKKTTCFVMALALALGLTQCKKEQTNSTVEPQGVRITLNVEGNGSRHSVNPTDDGATVSFEDGDVIYVGDGHTYIGTLTRVGGTFSGEISTPQGDRLHFYFVGGLPSGDLTKGNSTSFGANISDQSSKLPVLAYNSVSYAGATSYTCKLRNKCALVKFDLTNGTPKAIQVDGLLNTTAINFDLSGEAEPIAAGNATGAITLNNPLNQASNERWAILLPGSNLGNATYNGGSLTFTGDVPAVANNGYINSGIQIATPTPTLADAWETGATVVITYNYNPETYPVKNTCTFRNDGGGTFTFVSGTGWAGGTSTRAKEMKVEGNNLIFKQNFYDQIDDLWNYNGYQVTFDKSTNAYEEWKGQLALEQNNPYFISISVDGVDITDQLTKTITITVDDLLKEEWQNWDEIVSNNPTLIYVDDEDYVRRKSDNYYLKQDNWGMQRVTVYDYYDPYSTYVFEEE